MNMLAMIALNLYLFDLIQILIGTPPIFRIFTSDICSHTLTYCQKETERLMVLMEITLVLALWFVHV